MKSRTEHDYRRRIAKVIETILADPSAPHSVDSLAAVANFSPFHFHRLYRALTGESVANTVRRMRLAQAAHKLNTPSASITDAAFNAGYESPQSFSRAFRDLTGLSPTDFKEQQQAVAGQVPPITIIEREIMTVFALRHEGPAATIPHSYKRLHQWALDRGIAWRDVTRVGICYGDPEQDEGFKYFAGVIMPEGIGETDGLEQRALDGGRYVAYRLIGPYALISPTFQALFGGWLPQSGLEPDDRPAIELYQNHPTGVKDDELVTDLLIPIREPDN